MQFFEKKCRMCTEKREINVYNALGVAVPEANCKYPNDNGDAIDDEEIDDYAVADPALEAIGGELE